MSDPNNPETTLPLIQDPSPAEEASSQLSERDRRLDEDAQQEAEYDTY